MKSTKHILRTNVFHKLDTKVLNKILADYPNNLYKYTMTNGYFLSSWVCFKIWKLINVIHHINILVRKLIQLH